jgi:hypothetical protein
MEFSGIMKAGEFRMKKKRFSETQIIKIFKEAESGVPVNDLARQYSFGKSTFYSLVCSNLQQLDE